MAFTDFLINTLTVKAKGNTQAANAGFARTESTESSNIPCMIQDNAAGQSYIANSRGMINDHPIVTQYAGIDNGDTVVIETTQGSSVTCRVNSVNWRRGKGNIDDFYVLSVVEIEN